VIHRPRHAIDLHTHRGVETHCIFEFPTSETGSMSSVVLEFVKGLGKTVGPSEAFTKFKEHDAKLGGGTEKSVRAAISRARRDLGWSKPRGNGNTRTAKKPAKRGGGGGGTPFVNGKPSLAEVAAAIATLKAAGLIEWDGLRDRIAVEHLEALHGSISPCGFFGYSVKRLRRHHRFRSSAYHPATSRASSPAPNRASSHPARTRASSRRVFSAVLCVLRTTVERDMDRPSARTAANGGGTSFAFSSSFLERGVSESDPCRLLFSHEKLRSQDIFARRFFVGVLNVAEEGETLTVWFSD
jgi:hypothetical protein